jgi:hypothetical protein
VKLKALILPLTFFVLSFTLRMYKLDNPLGDWHSWRQADTASVAREYTKTGIDLFHPKYLDLSSIPSGLDNPEGWRMVEFPMINALHAIVANTFPQLGLVEWGRVLSAIASSLTVIILYLLTRKLSGKLVGVFVGLIYAILPYNIFYGRVILPEPYLVLFMMSSLYFFVLYWDTKRIHHYIHTLLTLTLAVLLKPTALVILLPMVGYALAALASPLYTYLLSLALPFLAIIPYLLWRRYIAAYPAGIPASDWLFNGNGIRFKGAWFRWLFGERIGKMILGYWGLIPFGAGLAALGERKKETLVYGGFLLGSLAYLAIIATGNVQHDYYQIQIMPTIAIFVGLGFATLIRSAKGLRRLYIALLSTFILVLSLALSWYELRGFFWVNNSAMVEAGQAVDKLVPAEALIIAPYMGDTAFLFQTNRRGWPIGGEIEDKISKGADYYVTTTRDDEYNKLIKEYSVIQETDTYSIIKL